MRDSTHAGRNMIDFARNHAMFRNPACRFEVSARRIIPTANPIDYIKIYYPYLDAGQIESVFGNAVYPSRFYGGRTYELERSLTNDQIDTLNAQGIGVSLTLTGHYFDGEVYEANRPFLDRFHRKGNAVVCTNDKLARNIRRDFPNYLLKASLIKHITTLERVERELSLYDRVVIPMDMNDYDDFLEGLPEKERIVLFANANCAYNCPARTCYAAISQDHWGKQQASACSVQWLPRENSGHIFFNVEKFVGMGFRHFKLVPRISPQADSCLRMLAAKRHPVTGKITALRAATIHSYPKCGRTWLRTLLANYFNHYYGLHVPVNLQTLFTLIPNDHSGLKGVEHYQFSHVARMPLLVASHDERSLRNSGDILVLRSIPDVVVSDYFQHRKLDAFEGDLMEFITADFGSLHRYCRYLNGWAGQEAWRDMHVLTYEGLHADTAGELARLLRHLRVEVVESLVKQAVSESGFEAMQRAERSAGHAGMPDDAGDPEMLKVRKGTVGGYKDYLSTKQIEQMFALAGELLSPQAKAMLEGCGLTFTPPVAQR